ncbi:MAG: deoxyhypusine synthase [Thaumarchaeota archaeon]|nr:deoxyhypusine synthase [Nitrososphaerota archaeon]
MGESQKVQDINLEKARTFLSLIRGMGKGGGFTGKYLADGFDILSRMTSEAGCVRFLSFPAAIIATGLRGVIKELVKRKLFDVLVTTCGTLDHDLARSWKDYLQGDFALDDVLLERKGFHRLGSVLVPKDAYGPLLEEKITPFLTSLYKEGIRSVSSSELCKRLGEYVDDESSILYWANRNSIPIIVPGITDGAVGNQLWLFSQRHIDFSIDMMKDQQILSDMVFTSKKTGALMIGGGISKHHTLWWNQFRGGLDYAVYITTAVEYDGSLSGALVREAISWGKVKPRAKQVTIHADATAVLPLLVAALLEK